MWTNAPQVFFACERFQQLGGKPGADLSTAGTADGAPDHRPEPALRRRADAGISANSTPDQQSLKPLPDKGRNAAGIVKISGFEQAVR